MQGFLRAVRVSLRRRATLTAVLFTSLVGALLWGANIGAVYPVMEVVLQGKSLHQWIDGQIAESERHIAEFRAQIADAQARSGAPAATAEGRRTAAAEAEYLQQRLAAEEEALAASRRLEPWIRSYLPDRPFETLVLLIAGLLVVTFLKDGLLGVNLVLVERLSQGAAVDLRETFFRRTVALEPTAFGKAHTAELLARCSEVNNIAGGLSILFGKITREPLKMLACLIGAAWVSPRLLLLSVVVAPLTGYLTVQLARAIRRAGRRSLEQAAKLYGRIAETFSSLPTVQAYTMEAAEAVRFRRVSHELQAKLLRMAWYNALLRVNTEVIGLAMVGGSVLAGSYLVLHQQTHLFGVQITERPLSFGTLLLFYAFLVGAADPMRKLTDVFNQLQTAAAAADRFYQLVDREPSIVDPPQPRELPAGPREIVLDRVSFHYQPGEPVLREVSLTIAPGERLAIVGPNGCGKSTLLNLIPRFLDPVAGAVRLGGADLREVKLTDLRRRIAIVSQQPNLFDDTVRDNIRYGDPEADDARVEAAARAAHAHRFIVEQLEEGYDTRVGERGGRLSGGQRQRIALARALLRDPEILILDEATSQIDPESEHLIHQALDEFSRGRTVVLVTHRLSTLCLADRILVMDAGRVVDLGRHEELIRRCEIYQRLHRTEERQAA